MKRLAWCWLCLSASLLGCQNTETPSGGGEPGGASSQNTPQAVTPVQSLYNSIGMELVRIPAGQFFMGSLESDAEARNDEKRHLVRITRPFFMSAYEVTQEEFAAVMGTNPSFFAETDRGKSVVAGHDTRRFPAEQVTWLAATEFCQRLSALPTERRAGRVYRLPTEAEWEYACRAGTTTRFHFGETPTTRQANFDGEAGGSEAEGVFLARTTKVGSYPPNSFGLYDMHGNVWEWCMDWYDADYYDRSVTDDPPGPRAGSARVIRGGAWYSDARDCRSAFRYADVPEGVFYEAGLQGQNSGGSGKPPVNVTINVSFVAK